MRFEAFSFGSIRIDGVTHEHDVIIDQGQVHKRKKKPSQKFRKDFGHTLLSIEEDIPWRCRRLIIGTETGALPAMNKVKQEAKRRKIKLFILPTVEYCGTYCEGSAGRPSIACNCGHPECSAPAQ